MPSESAPYPVELGDADLCASVDQTGIPKTFTDAASATPSRDA